ncbi:Uncharacterised protein [Yersinia pseudotuberculosis]|nr:Uncharacterised protein [Yersinia pseudotuberculosis]SUP90419.1 Uncharacterised protein [Yersinia pseudotuberculosis]
MFRSVWQINELTQLRQIHVGVIHSDDIDLKKNTTNLFIKL